MFEGGSTNHFFEIIWRGHNLLPVNSQHCAGGLGVVQKGITNGTSHDWMLLSLQPVLGTAETLSEPQKDITMELS